MDDMETTGGGIPASEPSGAATQGDTGSAEPGDKSSAKPDEALRQLQSDRDKEVARANKLQKELDNMKAASAKGEGTSEVPPQVQEWIVAAQRRTRDALYESNPKFKAYNVSPDLITGDTPAAMEASLQSLTAFVDKLEASVRDQVLLDHGFNPEPQASIRAEGKNFKTMASEEFNRLVENALRG